MAEQVTVGTQLFIASIPPSVTCRDIDNAVTRANLGTVASVSIRQGKGNNDYAVVTLSPWNMERSEKCRQVLGRGGFWKIYYGKDLYWKAYAFKTKSQLSKRSGAAAAVAAPSYYGPQTPESTPPSTPRAPPTFVRESSIAAPLTEVQEATSSPKLVNPDQDQDQDQDTVSELSYGSDECVVPVGAAGTALDYSGADMNAPRKRRVLKRQLVVTEKSNV
uniref:Uncharacterized protein n=1 Tax=viral metagenome TaxID=1070528 RepID=A0A6C0I4E5_9ZZZZ